MECEKEAAGGEKAPKGGFFGWKAWVGESECEYECVYEYECGWVRVNESVFMWV
jgi:hypothetical protein